MSDPAPTAKTHPSEVAGKYRSRRERLSLALVLIFLLLPWLRIHSQQALLIDVPGRKFNIFGLLFWGHDVPILLFVVAIFILTLMVITAIFGRAWCGWGCPQTVFIEQVFRRIERWVEGDAVARRRLDAQEWTANKVGVKALKWSAFTLVAAVIAHSFLAYFVGTDQLAHMIASSPAENPVSFVVMLGFSAFTLFNFGWLRERFCMRICPYGRFQSVLLDEDSWGVAYDAKRGEPRRGVSSTQKAGDCISCNKCVTACPTGIDIRNGLQLECIACTACMDACNSVMRKTGRAENLIRYASQRQDTAPQTQVSPLSWKTSVFRTRPIIYATILGILVLGLFLVLEEREALDVIFIRSTGTPYEEISRPGVENEIVNRYVIDFHNLTFMEREVKIEMLEASAGLSIVSAELPVRLRAGEQKRIPVFFKFPKSFVSGGSKKINLTIQSHEVQGEHPTHQSEEVRLVGPY